MPMDIEFDDKAIKFLVSPPKPSQPLRDIILILGKSTEIAGLALMGRGLLRSCVSARMYTPPISEKFDLIVDDRVSDSKLASVAERCGLLQRLNIDGVANEVDSARLLCAYLGAAFRCAWKEHGVNAIHRSVNDICSLILDAGEEPAVVENNSHERMMKIQGVEKMPTPAYAPKVEPPSVTSPMPTRGHPGMAAEMDTNSGESVSSGPVPTSSPSFAPPQPPQQPAPAPGGYQQGPYQQPQYASPPQGVPPQPSNMASGGWQNPPGYGMPAQMPVPPPPGQQTQGFISLFNELAMKNRLVTSWQQQKTGQQHIPEWTMWLIVDGTPRGHGTAPTKQAAKEVAAKTALQAMGWLAA
ncbi:hypothetical protein FRC12_015338 [Ceratobasidium sp. 428]|nr:hypothetical protein FRC12_015338 [Ceratobasidium sp. 428]